MQGSPFCTAMEGSPASAPKTEEDRHSQSGHQTGWDSHLSWPAPRRKNGPSSGRRRRCVDPHDFEPLSVATTNIRVQLISTRGSVAESPPSAYGESQSLVSRGLRSRQGDRGHRGGKIEASVGFSL